MGSRARPRGLGRVTGTRRVIVAKSLSCTAGPVAAAERVPAVWLTPLLIEPEVVAGFDTVTAPALLVGGTADPLWDGDTARGIAGVEVLELDGADHSLEVPGDLAASTLLLAEVATTIDEFVAAAA